MRLVTANGLVFKEVSKKLVLSKGEKNAAGVLIRIRFGASRRKALVLYSICRAA